MTDRYIDNSGSNTSPYDTWAKAATNVTTGIASVANTDRGFVSNDHFEVTVGPVSLAFPSSPGYQLLGVDTNATEPPTGLNSTPAAIVSVGASSSALSTSGFAYVYGILFQGGTNASNSCDIQIGAGSLPFGQTFENCKFDIRANATGAVFLIGPGPASGNDDGYTFLKGCQVKFANASQSIFLQQSRIHIQNLSIDSAGTAPTTLFAVSTGAPCDALIEASDLAGETWTNLISVAAAGNSRVVFRNCKLPSGFALSTGTNPGPGGPVVKVHNCDSGDTNYSYGESAYAGTIVYETTLVRTGGGTVSYRMDCNSNTKFPYLALELEGSIRNTSTGSAKTLTVEILHDSATNLQNDEIWVEVQHLGTSGFPLALIDIDDRAADVFATPADQETSSVTWTTTGMTNPNKQKLVCTFTPQEAGYVHFKVCLATGTAKTVYVDLGGASIA